MQLPKLLNWSRHWPKKILNTISFSRRTPTSRSNVAPIFSLDRPNTRKRNKKRLIIRVILLFLTILLVFLVIKLGILEKYVFSYFRSFSSHPPKVVIPNKSFEDRLKEELITVFPESSVTRLNSYTIEVQGPDKLVVLFNPDKEMSTQVRSLQTIITQSRIDKKQLKKIDLRFDKIALEYFE